MFARVFGLTICGVFRRVVAVGAPAALSCFQFHGRVFSIPVGVRLYAVNVRASDGDSASGDVVVCGTSGTTAVVAVVEPSRCGRCGKPMATFRYT